MKYGQTRSCCPRIVFKLERKCVVHIVQDSSSTSSSPARLRRDDTHVHASGNRGDPPKINQKGDNIQATRGRLRDVPMWLEEFTENLEDTELPALANISHDSDPERAFFKVASRSTVFALTSRKTDIAKSASEPKFQGPHAEDAMAKPYFEPQILVF